MKLTKKLLSAEEELRLCRKAFGRKLYRRAIRSWHVFHDKIYGTAPPGVRIAMILSDKPAWQHARRFREFRPVKDAARADELWETWFFNPGAKAKAARRKLEALHRRECPWMNWNGRTIFAGERKRQ